MNTKITVKSTTLLCVCLILNKSSIGLPLVAVAAEYSSQVVDVLTDQGFLTVSDEGSLQTAPRRSLLLQEDSIFMWLCDVRVNLLSSNMETCIANMDSIFFTTSWLKTKVGGFFDASKNHSPTGPVMFGGDNKGDISQILYTLRIALAALLCQSYDDEGRLGGGGLLGNSKDSTVQDNFATSIYNILAKSEEFADLKTLIKSTESDVKTALQAWQAKLAKKNHHAATTVPDQQLKNGSEIMILDTLIKAVNGLADHTKDFVTLYTEISKATPTKADVQKAINFLLKAATPMATAMAAVFKNTIPKRLHVQSSSVGRDTANLFGVTWPTPSPGVVDPFVNSAKVVTAGGVKGTLAVYAADPTTDKTIVYLPPSGGQTASTAQAAITAAVATTSNFPTVNWDSIKNNADISAYILGYDEKAITDLLAVGEKGNRAPTNLQTPLSGSSFLFSMAFLGLATYFAA